MTDTKIRLYLDVDGVINAPMPMGWGNLEQKTATAEGLEFRIRWAPNMLAALESLDLDLAWTTTWRDDAPRSIGSVTGFGKRGRVIHPGLDPLAETYYPSIDWKFPAVMEDQRLRPSPFIWIDDEIDGHHKRWADENGGLALSPNPLLGISPKDMARIQGFIERCSVTTGVYQQES